MRATEVLRDPSRLVALAPLVFLLHVAEEAPGFVAWFNAHVSPPISPSLFLGVNATAFVITVGVAVLATTSADPAPAALALGWLSLVMLANGLFHLVATVVHEEYAPGVLTGCLLYIPYASWLTALWFRRWPGERLMLVCAMIVGATPMLLHGYLIVFRGSRLL